MQPSIITPLNLHQKQRIVFLGYTNDLHHISTLQDFQNHSGIKKLNSLKRKLSVTVSKIKELLAKKRKHGKQCRTTETNDAQKLCLENVSELDEKHRANETSDAKKTSA